MPRAPHIFALCHRAAAVYLALYVLLVAADPTPRFLGLRRPGEHAPPTRLASTRAVAPDYDMPAASAPAPPTRGPSTPAVRKPAPIPSPGPSLALSLLARSFALSSPVLERAGAGPPLRC